MAHCEDYPCCGHELGCCPDFDESGRQINMVCTCGAKHHGESGTSLCVSCLHAPDPHDPESWDDRAEFLRDDMLERQELEDFDETDEAYGHFGEYDDMFANGMEL